MSGQPSNAEGIEGLVASTRTVPWAVMRWLFALPTAAIVTSGAVYAVRTNGGELDVNFFGLLAIALLPTAVYLAGVRTPRCTFACGAWLLAVTAAGWALILQDDPMRGLGALFAFVITLLCSTIFVFRERTLRRHP
jgi:hypothetical protein